MDVNTNNGAVKPKTDAKKRNDIILIAAVLAVVVIAAALMLLLRQEGDRVSVSIDGKIVGEYSLNYDQTVELKSDNGYNILVIKDGKAYVSEASCPDGICSSHRPIRYGGESIICLPNKVVVEVISQGDDTPDVIN